MLVRQKSSFSAFTYEIFDSSDKSIGEIIWPDFSLARNSNLNSFKKVFKKTQVTFNIKDDIYNIDFDFLNVQWFNDIEFTLIEQKSNKILSVAQIVSVQE